MEILLRGKTYPAEHLTDINYLPLGNIFVDEETGNPDIILDDNISDAAKIRLGQAMIKKLSNPTTKASVASALISIFPTLPKELVRFSLNGDFALNLTANELTYIVNACSEEFSTQPQNKLRQELDLLKNEIRDKSDRLDQLLQQIGDK